MPAALKKQNGKQEFNKGVQIRIFKALSTLGIVIGSFGFSYAHAISVTCFDNYDPTIMDGNSGSSWGATWPSGGVGMVDFGPIAQPTAAQKADEAVLATKTATFTVQCKDNRQQSVISGIVYVTSKAGDWPVDGVKGTALFPTNVQGVMYRVTMPATYSSSCARKGVQLIGSSFMAPGGGKYLSNPTSASAAFQGGYTSTGCNGYFDATIDFTVELVASNRNFQASPSATMLDGQLFYVWYLAMGKPTITYPGYGSAAFRFGPSQVTPRLCTLSIPNVRMGSVSASDIENNRAPEKTSEIRIDNCPAGANISLNTVDVYNRSSLSGNVLKLAPGDGSAQGVGIELKYKDRPAIVFGTSQNLTTSAREGSQDTITLVARYVKNGTGPVLAGRADGQAEITLIHR